MYLSQSFHHGKVTGMDVCIRKPILATCSTDQSIRIWNYLDCSCSSVKYFTEEIYSVAVHPSAMYILAGFSDKLRLMSFLVDDIKPFKEFPLRACREVLCFIYSSFTNASKTLHIDSLQSWWSIFRCCLWKYRLCILNMDF